MSLTGLDLAIIAIPFGIILTVAVAMRRYMRSVADYLAASRCAGRYLITSASGETMTGILGMVTALEIFSRTGFSLTFWNGLTAVILFFVGLLGLVTYRMRETRALTFHQFLEVRYSTGVRVMASFLNVFSGLFSFGVGPAVGARFFVYFCGLPDHVRLLGWPVPTFAVIMLVAMATSLILTLSGGQISMIVTDSLEALFSKYLYLVVVLFILATVSVAQFQDVLLSGPPHKSFIDPFDIADQPDFGIWFVVFTVLLSLYQYRGAGSGFTVSARTPHESRMAGVLVNWRGCNYAAMVTLISLGAFTLLHHPDFAAQRAAVDEGLKHVGSGSLQTQLRMPLALGVLLAPGIKGCLCAVALFGLIANQSNYIHMYSTTIFQDVILPLRRKALPAQAHIRWLRGSAVFVALFACVFSLVFKPVDYLKMITMLLGTIYLGGISCVVWGGLYWRRGTTGGALAAMGLASILAVGLNVATQAWASIVPLLTRALGPGRAADYLAAHAQKFPFNGMELSFIISVLACATYVAISLLSRRAPFNLDAMLHRGAYRLEEGDAAAPVPLHRSLLARLINITPAFTHGDRILAYATLGWTLFWQALAIGVLMVTLLAGHLSQAWWFHYTMVTNVWITVAVAGVVTVWFTWGILRDMLVLFRTLKAATRNDADDGTVRNHHNAGESTQETGSGRTGG